MMMPRLPPALRTSLGMAAAAMARAQAPWWVIGSAAVVLHGARDVTIGDIDILFDLRDADALRRGLGLALGPGRASPLFRSRAFDRWSRPPVTVEMMAGFQRFDGDGWIDVRPASRQPVVCDGAVLYVPSQGELTALLRAFGRPKDLERAALLG